MIAVRGRCERRWVPRRVCAGALAFGCVMLVACGQGISLDPLGPRRPQDDAGDGSSEVLDGDNDVSLDGTSTRDASEQVDASAMPDSSKDSSSEATEAPRADAISDADAGEERVVDVFSGRETGIEDAGNDAVDVLPDAADESDVEAGDGCTVACGWPDADYYVDAHAAVDGDGSRANPFKTITRAIAAYREAPGRAKSAYVAAGTYDRALGEEFPLVLRGLSLKGAGRDATFIVGAGLLDHAAEGGAFHGQYLVTIVAGDRELETALADVSVRPENPVPALNHYGVFCDRGSATGEVLPPAGQAQLERVTVGPGYHASVIATTSTAPAVTGCSIVLRSSVLTGGWTGVRANGCDPMKVSGPVVVEMGGPDPASGNVVSWMQAPNDGASGVSFEGCVIRGYFQNNAFVDSAYGIMLDTGHVPVGSFGFRPVTIKNNAFERLTAGGIVVVEGLIQIDELSDNRFIGISRVVSQDPGPPAVAVSSELARLGKVRRNLFVGNDFGVLLRVPGQSAAADLGTVEDPGNNVFRCNSALRGAGADLAFSAGENVDAGAGWAGTVSAVGNAWDHATPTVLSDEPTPNGCDISLIRVPSLTLDLRNSSLATAECPMDRVPGK